MYVHMLYKMILYSYIRFTLKHNSNITVFDCDCRYLSLCATLFLCPFAPLCSAVGRSYAQSASPPSRKQKKTDRQQ
jgi:hypothetical protein